jgi:hypothetical protein
MLTAFHRLEATLEPSEHPHGLKKRDAHQCRGLPVSRQREGILAVDASDPLRHSLVHFTVFEVAMKSGADPACLDSDAGVDRIDTENALRNC